MIWRRILLSPPLVWLSSIGVALRGLQVELVMLEPRPSPSKANLRFKIFADFNNH